MKCSKCSNNPDGFMDLVTLSDSPNGGYAFNVYHCKYCDAICKEDVWNHPGKIWILTSGEVIKEPKE